MKKVFALCLAALLVWTFAGCAGEAGGISLAGMDLGEVSKIKVNNCHNGQDSLVTDREDILEICEFLRTLSGKPSKQQEGWYEGSYALTLLDGADQVVFEIGFGDSDAFFCTADGVHTRFDMADITAKDVIAFFSRFDTSGFQWE